MANAHRHILSAEERAWVCKLNKHKFKVNWRHLDATLLLLFSVRAFFSSFFNFVRILVFIVLLFIRYFRVFPSPCVSSEYMISLFLQTLYALDTLSAENTLFYLSEESDDGTYACSSYKEHIIFWDVNYWYIYTYVHMQYNRTICYKSAWKSGRLYLCSFVIQQISQLLYLSVCASIEWACLCMCKCDANVFKACLDMLSDGNINEAKEEKHEQIFIKSERRYARERWKLKRSRYTQTHSRINKKYWMQK